MPDEIVVPMERIEPFEPQELGVFQSRMAAIVEGFEGLSQAQILLVINDETRAVLADCSGARDASAYRAALLVLADYVMTGYYPVIIRGRCCLVPLWEGGSDTLSRRKSALRAVYERVRDRDMGTEAGVRRLSAALDLLNGTRYDPAALLRLVEADAFLPSLEVPDTAAKRLLWTGVRATWSMGSDKSAPGREVSLVLSDGRYPMTPVGVLQYRNVVPGIRARDMWLGLHIPETGQGGYLDAIDGTGDAVHAMRATRAILVALLKNVDSDGVITPLEKGYSADLRKESESNRKAYHSKKGSNVGGSKDHLAITKRTSTAADLLLGIEAFDFALGQANPRQAILEPAVGKGCEVGLRKIWHYHMGFVAVELSICGAAPPFGPLRIGKLMAMLAASDEALSHWGVGRPLGDIARTTYLPSVRDAVPNPGPLALFTSGLYPGHSAQYNRLVVGDARWKKYGDSAGWGGFTVSDETVRALTHYNAAVDGYRHVTHAFGEGSSARMRVIGQALRRLGLPDIRQHNVRRPLYVLPLVPDVPGALFGWAKAERPSRSLESLYREWRVRWLELNLPALVDKAGETPSLVDDLHRILARVEQYRPAGGTGTQQDVLPLRI